MTLHDVCELYVVCALVDHVLDPKLTRGNFL
jgi:hypothetical protein